jgi:gas vesicle protein
MARGNYGREDGFDNATFRRGTVGRYTEWEKRDPEVTLQLLEMWARDGYMDSEMWQKLRISENTFYRWKKQLPEVAEALKRGKEASNAHIENAIFKAATQGWTWEETIVETEDLVNDDGSTITKTNNKVLKKHVPPNTTALIFLLKNRMPEKYMDRKHVETNVNGSLRVHDEKTVAENIKEYGDTFKDTAKIVMGFVPAVIAPTVFEEDDEDDVEVEQDWEADDLQGLDDSEESNS